jgi:predicted kinase
VLEIAIPDPSLVVLVGAAGSGKSTFAARHFGPDEVLSSDRYRELVSGDAANQAATRAAFGRLHLDLARRLSARRLTVVDATNIERGARLALLQRAAREGLPSVAVVFDLPAELVLARNAARAIRVVDETVVRNHLARVRALLDGPGAGFESEGFSLVAVVRDPLALDSVQVVRTTSWADSTP